MKRKVKPRINQKKVKYSGNKKKSFFQRMREHYTMIAAKKPRNN